MKKLFLLLTLSASLLLCPKAAEASQAAPTITCSSFNDWHLYDSTQPSQWCYMVSFNVTGIGKWLLYGYSVTGVPTLVARGAGDMGNNSSKSFIITGTPDIQAGLMLVLIDADGWTH